MVDLYEIYLITNLSNNKKYVGQVVKHRGYLTRFREHMTGAKYANTRLLSNAVRKHGADMFKVELIESDIPEANIDQREAFYIDKFNTFYLYGKGYNMTKGGQGVHSYKHTEEDKIKISAASKRNWEILYADQRKLKERNKKISEGLTGITRSSETRQKLSAIAKNRFKNSPGTFAGKHHTFKAKQLIAEKNGFPVGMYDKESGELLKTFVSVSEASKYLLDNGLTTNRSCFTRILTVCKQIKGQGKTAYGYIWKFLEKKCIDYPGREQGGDMLPSEVLSLKDIRE